MKRRSLKVIGIVATVVLVCIVIFGFGLRYAERFYAARAAAMAIEPGMTRAQVVESLGVMYYDCSRGEYDRVDRILNEMGQADFDGSVCFWRVAHSRDIILVAFDESNLVVGAEIVTSGQ